jgi:hypothetical protein
MPLTSGAGNMVTAEEKMPEDGDGLMLDVGCLMKPKSCSGKVARLQSQLAAGEAVVNRNSKIRNTHWLAIANAEQRSEVKAP